MDDNSNIICDISLTNMYGHLDLLTMYELTNPGVSNCFCDDNIRTKIHYYS